MSRSRAFLGSLALMFAACGGQTNPSTPVRTIPAVVPTLPAPTARPTAPPSVAPSVAPTPTSDPVAAYLALAEKVNAKWRALGPVPTTTSGNASERTAFVAKWFAIQDEIARGLALIDWPSSAATEASTLQRAAANLRTLLQPSGDSAQFLDLISFQALGDQKRAAAAVRARLGLPTIDVTPSGTDLI